MEKEVSRFPQELINIRVQANSSYQIKRVLEALQNEKGLELMSVSGIKRNCGEGPKLRQFATFKDLKAEKKKLKKFEKKYKL